MKMIALGILGVILFAVVIGFSLASRGKAEDSRASAAPPPVIANGPLDEDGFWKLVDHSAALESNPDAQIADLQAGLRRLNPEQIAGFEKVFDATMRKSYTWDLWGAAYLANHGASDDGFEYFRCWLISKGRATFERVSADPDVLAALLAAEETGGDLEFEKFAYVAREVWAEKTGRDWNDMPTIANMAYGDQPSGRPFTENSKDLALRYPKLWKRFGDGS